MVVQLLYHVGEFFAGTLLHFLKEGPNPRTGSYDICYIYYSCSEVLMERHIEEIHDLVVCICSIISIDFSPLSIFCVGSLTKRTLVPCFMVKLSFGKQVLRDDLSSNDMN